MYEYTPTEDITIRGHYEPLTISLADDASNEETLYTHNGKRAQSVTLSGRTLYKDNDWNTLCLHLPRQTLLRVRLSPAAGIMLRPSGRLKLLQTPIELQERPSSTTTWFLVSITIPI